jgi:hypothetical protein
MTPRKLLSVGLIGLFAFALAGAAAPRDGNKAPAREANRITGILKSVDAAHGAFTLERVGVDVDEALAQKLKERGKDKDAKAAKPQAAENTQDVSISARTKIYIKFRTSPSVANNVELGLKDLQKMIGYPVTVEVAVAGEKPVAAEVVAWRGTPWKLRN